MKTPLDAFQTLDLPAGARPEQIKQAYRRAALRWHPDRRPDDPHAARRFAQAHQAYRLLMARAPGPRPRRSATAVDFARRDLSWLHAGSYSAPMTPAPRRRPSRRSRAGRMVLVARMHLHRVRPVLQVCGWVLVVTYLLLGTIGAAQIVEGCHRRCRQPGPDQPYRAAWQVLPGGPGWVLGWALAGAGLIALSGPRRRQRRLSGLLLISASGSCLAMSGLSSVAWLLLLASATAAQLTVGAMLAGSRTPVRVTGRPGG
jgi:hypothetical protein